MTNTKWNSIFTAQGTRIEQGSFSVWDGEYGLTVYVNHFAKGASREVFGNKAGDILDRADFPTSYLTSDGGHPRKASVEDYAKATFATYRGKVQS